MKKTVPQIQYNRLLALYIKLNKRLQNHFAAGRFHKFTKEQQQRLLTRIEKLKAQLSLLENRVKLAGAALLAGAMLTTNEASAQFGPVGPQFLVNTYTTNNQQFTDVAADSAGDFVVIWASLDQAGGAGDTSAKYDIYAQRYNAAGLAQGSQFLVNTYTTGNQKNPSIAMDSKGEFVVTWMSYNEYSYDSYYDIYAQRFNADGQPVGSEFQVNTFTTYNQVLPSVAVDGKGDFIITWMSYDESNYYSYFDVYARRYNAAGAPVGYEFQVNTFTTGYQGAPFVAMDKLGDFVITWMSYDEASSSSGYDIYAQRFDSSGTAQGSEFLVNAYTTGYQGVPVAAMDYNGDFIIAWSGYNSASLAGDTNDINVNARRFNAAGVAQDRDFMVNTFTIGYQGNPAIAMDSKGDFIITWESYNEAGFSSSYDIYARRYNATAAAQSPELLINAYTTGFQAFSAITTDSLGDFVVTWASYNEAGSTSKYDVYAQRFSSDTSTIITAVSGQTAVSLFNLYPNPSQGQVQISLTGDAYVTVTDMTGHALIQEQLQGNTLSLAGLNAGMYMVEVTQNGATEIKKLIVQQ